MLSSFSCFLFFKHLTQFPPLKFIFSLCNKCVGFFLVHFLVEHFVSQACSATLLHQTVEIMIPLWIVFINCSCQNLNFERKIPNIRIYIRRITITGLFCCFIFFLLEITGPCPFCPKPTVLKYQTKSFFCCNGDSAGKIEMKYIP